MVPGPNRSIALSIASTGLSLGGVAVTPATAYLFNSLGAQATMPWLGLSFALLIVPIALFLIRPAPVAPGVSGGVPESSWGYSEAVRTRFFILLAVGYVFCQGAQVGGISHLYNRVDEIAGFEAAARAVQILTICAILFRFLGGWLVTRIAIRWYTLTNVMIQCCGLAILANADSAGMAWLGAAVFGASIGNILMLQPLWLAEAFPGRFTPGICVGQCGISDGRCRRPVHAGFSYDSGDYSLAYGLAVATSLVAGLFILSAGPRPVRPNVETS